MPTQLSIVNRVENTMAAMKKQFESTLPAHISPTKFMRAAVTAIQNTPDLQECEHDSIISACQKAATDGLIIDNREAALVTFKKNIGTQQKPKWVKHAQYMPMVAGILKKARNSGQISSISAHVVYQNDEFEYELGLNPVLTHKPLIDGPSGDLRCCYAIAKLKDGGVDFRVMTKPQIMKVAMTSRSGWDSSKNKLKGIWKIWEDEMWCKTVLKRLCKYLPSSTDLDGIIDYDNKTFGAADLVDEPGKQETMPAKKKSTKAEDAILSKDKKNPEEKEIEGSDDASSGQDVI